MYIHSFTEQSDYSENKIQTKLIVETSFSKEIRILMSKGQVMKEHTAPYPIIVHVTEGSINFGVKGKYYSLKKGSIITLDANIIHDLEAIDDSTIRLTLSKHDKVERVSNVVDNL